MLEEIISNNPNAPVMVIFGGSPIRRDEVLTLIKSMDIDVTAYAVLSEEEGLSKIQSLKALNLVLIGGRYVENQRFRIKNFVKGLFPNALFTEPGWAYPYNNENIQQNVLAKIQQSLKYQNQ